MHLAGCLKPVKSYVQNSQTNFAVDVIPLLSNDIEVYYGEFTDEPEKILVVNKLNIQKFCVDGIDEEVNTVECKI